MALDTYANLKTEIEEWLDRPDLSAKIDTFIDLAEATIRRRCKGITREIRAQTTVGASSRYVQLPVDFKGILNLSVRASDGGGYMEMVTPDHLDRLNEQFGANYTADVPFYYAVHGNEIEIFPVPAADTVIEMTFIESLTSLDTGVTNVVFTTHPDIYLWASLCAAAPYVMEDDRLPIWKGLLDTAIQEYNQEAEQLKYGSAPLIMRPSVRLTRRA
jgi:hypothetical protein